MQRLTENRIVLIVRKTRLDDLIARFNTLGNAKFYVEHLGADFTDYQLEHDQYYAAVRAAEESLDRLGLVHLLDHTFLPNYVFGNDDTIVTLGQDGLVANTLKYLSVQPVIGINPDPKRWEGVLLPFKIADLSKIVPEVFKRARPIKKVTMAKAQLNNGSTLYGVNDIFIGPKSHTSARYKIQINGKSENHSSSGVIVSTGLGSSGWLRSILTGATGITRALTTPKIAPAKIQNYAWDLDQLFFSVREPWPSKTSAATLTFGPIKKNSPLILTSQMPQNGIIFSDGIEKDFLEFNSGTQAILSVAEKQGHLVC